MPERCVCCGDYIPEGRQVCQQCEKKGYKSYEQTEDVRDDETLHPEFKSRSEKEQAVHGRTQERKKEMKEYDATEQAFANGYSAGYTAGRRSAGIVPLPMKISVDVGANIPTRAHKHDAGLDLYATKGGWIFPKCRKIFNTGVHALIPAGYVGFLTSKSGMMLNGITSRGTIDSGYTGSIRAVLFNHSWLPVRIRKGQKVTQMVVVPCSLPETIFVDSLEDTERADGGFGSTGKF